MFTPSAARALLTRIIARGRRQGWMHWRPNWQLSANRQFSFSCQSPIFILLRSLAAVETKAELFLRMFTVAVALLNYVTRLITPGGNKAGAHLVTSSSGQTYYQNILSKHIIINRPPFYIFHFYLCIVCNAN